MSQYIYGKISKESIQQILKKIDSPFIELYRKKYAEKSDIERCLNDFFNSDIMKNYVEPDDIKFEEAQALTNWIYGSLRSIEQRREATEELFQLLKEKYNISSELSISQGIVYLSSRVELNFISSIDNFCNFIEGISSLGRTVFYRGHSEVNHILVPSLMRRRGWLINERKMYNELIIKCPDCFERMKSHLEYLVEMQHYGLPTRLLDITTNPLVALYFACESHLDTQGEVVIFSVPKSTLKFPQSDTVSILASLPSFEYDKQQEIYEYAVDENMSNHDFNMKVQRLLHEVKTEKPAFKDEIIKKDLLHSLVVLPLKNNNRIMKQDGAFILCGLSRDYKHLDINELRYKDQYGKQQILVIQEKQKFLDTLNAFSINKSTLFPEIDDVADYIKSKY